MFVILWCKLNRNYLLQKNNSDAPAISSSSSKALDLPLGSNGHAGDINLSNIESSLPSIQKDDEGWEDAEGENGVEKVAGAEVAENFDEVPAPSRLIGDSEFCGERLTSASVCGATEDGGKGSPTSLSREPSAASSSARDCSRALGEAAWCSKASCTRHSTPSGKPRNTYA